MYCAQGFQKQLSRSITLDAPWTASVGPPNGYPMNVPMIVSVALLMYALHVKVAAVAGDKEIQANAEKEAQYRTDTVFRLNYKF